MSTVIRNFERNLIDETITNHFSKMIGGIDNEELLEREKFIREKEFEIQLDFLKKQSEIHKHELFPKQEESPPQITLEELRKEFLEYQQSPVLLRPDKPCPKLNIISNFEKDPDSPVFDFSNPDFYPIERDLIKDPEEKRYRKEMILRFVVNERLGRKVKVVKKYKCQKQRKLPDGTFELKLIGVYKNMSELCTYTGLSKYKATKILDEHPENSEYRITLMWEF
jgi:hypothetical protein